MSNHRCPYCGAAFEAAGNVANCPLCRHEITAEELRSGTLDAVEFELQDSDDLIVMEDSTDSNESELNESLQQTYDSTAIEPEASAHSPADSRNAQEAKPDVGTTEPPDSSRKTYAPPKSDTVEISKTIDMIHGETAAISPQARRPAAGKPVGKQPATNPLFCPPGSDTSADSFTPTVDSAKYHEDPRFSATQKTIDADASFLGVGSSLADIPRRTFALASEPHKLSDYELKEELGKGSFGVVWRARQTALNRTVALKLLHDKHDTKTNETIAESQEQLRRRTEFLREAQFNGRLDHPNIVPIHELGVGDNGRPFYAMKEIRGISWRDVINEKNLDENLEILMRVADAMAFAHNRNILHCDLKPDNVMLGEFGEVLVVDWGQAIDVNDPETFRPGGSPAYISPEMAQYFCDSFIEGEQDPASKNLVGKSSDTYLLGAILFEIVCGYPPHPGYKGEGPLDVLKRATRNEIRDYQEFADHELMQIALGALRIAGGKRLLSIGQLQSEIRAYESRQRSIEVRQRAQKELNAARESQNYDAFQRARFGFEEAIELWDGNQLAKQGLQVARLSFASTALTKQDFDLGLAQVEQPETEDEVLVRNKLLRGRRARDRRKKLVAGLLFAVGAAIVIGLVTNTFLINKNIATKKEADVAIVKAESAEEKAKVATIKADAAEKLAVEKTAEAETQTLIAANATKMADAETARAELEKQKADQQKILAQQQTELATVKAMEAKQAQDRADELKIEADKLQVEADKQTTLAKQAADEAKKQQAIAEDQKLLAMQATKQAQEAAMQVVQEKEKARLVRFKNTIANIDRRLSAGDFTQAQDALEQIEVENRNWEWRRLKLLTHPEVTTLDPTTIQSAAVSGDGSRFAYATADAVIVTDFATPGKALHMIAIPSLQPGLGEMSIALTHDGSQLAIGLDGEISVYDLQSETTAASPVRAQRNGIYHLEFSKTGDRLLAVGAPDPLAQGDRSETVMMIWQRQNARWNRLAIHSGYNDPAMRRATFSEDGSRIVTAGGTTSRLFSLASNDAETIVQPIDTFSYLDNGKKTEINVSIFADPSGESVISGCDTTIVHWRPQGRAEEELAQVSFNTQNANRLLEIFPGHARPVSSIAISAAALDSQASSSQRLMISGERESGVLYVWNLREKSFRALLGHSSTIDFCALNADATQIISVSAGNASRIRKVDLNTYQRETFTVAAHDSLVAMSRSSDTGKTFFGSQQGLALVFRDQDLTSQNPLPDAYWNASPGWAAHLVAGDKVYSQAVRPPNAETEEIFVRQIDTGNLQRVLTLPLFKRFVVSANGQRLAILKQDDSIEIYHAQTGEKERTISAGTNQILSQLAISPDGKQIVSGLSGLYVWSTETGELLFQTARSSTDPQGALDSIHFVRDTSRFVAAWNNNQWLRLYDAEKSHAQPQGDYRGEFQALIDAVNIGGDDLLLLRSQDHLTVVKLSGAESLIPVATLDQSGFAQFSNANPTAIIVIDPVAAEPVVRWNWQDAKAAPQPIAIGSALAQPHVAITSVEMAQELSDGRILVEGHGHLIAFSKELQIGNLRIIPRAPCLFAGPAGAQQALTLHGGGDGKIRFWKFGSRKRGYLEVLPDGELAGAFSTCSVSPDMKYLLAIREAGTSAVLIDLSNREIVFEHPSETGSIRAISWSPDATHFALSSESGAYSIWSATAQPEVIAEFQSVASAVAGVSISLSNDLSALLSVGDDGKARVWQRDPEKGWREIELKQKQQVTAAGVSPDGTRAVTAATTGTMTLWNIADLVSTDNARQQVDMSERQLMEFYQHKSAVRFVDFTTDGSQLISAESAAEEAIFWPISR
jgi:serine/threonine protein kinase/WD40 repeat protein